MRPNVARVATAIPASSKQGDPFAGRVIAYRMLGNIRNILFLLLVVVLSGITHNAVAGDTLSYNDQRRYDYFFMEGLRQYHAGKYDAAFDLLNHCREINPKGAETYYLLAMFQSELGKDSLAMDYLQKAVMLRPSNVTYREQLAQHYINTRQFDNAIQAYEGLYQTDKSRSEVLEILLQLYQQQKNYDKMLTCIQRMEQIDGNSEELTLSKVRVYELKNDKKSAYKALKQLADEHPYDLNFRVMLGNWLMQNQKAEEAFKLFKSVLTAEPENGYALSSMYDYYRAADKKAEAGELAERILTNQKIAPQSKTTIIRQIIPQSEAEGGDSTKVLQLLDKVLFVNPADTDMYAMKVAYMTLKKMPTDSISAELRRWLKIAPDNAGARMQLLQNEWPKKDWDEIISLCKPATEYNPEEMGFYYFLGMAYFQKDENEKALDTFRRGVSEITAESNPNIASDFYAILGDLLHQKGNSKEAFAAYDSCLQWKADNYSCLNNYAYYLSEENIDLHRAAEMSAKTVKAEPKNATYLDTYAWILYKDDRFAEAKIYIEQAIANLDSTLHNNVIYEHAGDINERMGNHAAAVDYWTKALKSGGDKAALEQKIHPKVIVKPKSTRKKR